MAGELLAELRLVARLQLVVEFVAHPAAQLVHQAVGIETFQYEGRTESVEGLDVVEVRIDRLGDARVLNLDGYVPSITGYSSVHLADAGRGDRKSFPVEKDLLRTSAELLDDHLLSQSGRHRLGVGLQGCERLLCL